MCAQASIYGWAITISKLGIDDVKTGNLHEAWLVYSLSIAIAVLALVIFVSGAQRYLKTKEALRNYDPKSPHKTEVHLLWLVTDLYHHAGVLCLRGDFGTCGSCVSAMCHQALWGCYVSSSCMSALCRCAL